MNRLIRVVSKLGWKKIALMVAGGLVLTMLIVQFAYPFHATVPGAVIEGIEVGGMSRDEATHAVDDAFAERTLAIYFGDADTAYRTPTLDTLGIGVEADDAVGEVMYPWWLRLVPTSIWWAHTVRSSDQVTASLANTDVTTYVESELGTSCTVEPKNASIEVKDDTLQVVPAADGGTCELPEVIAAVAGITPRLSEANSVRIAMKKIAPAVDDDSATALLESITKRLEGGVTLTHGDTTKTIDAKTVQSWLEFSVQDDKLVATVSSEKAKDVLTKDIAPMVAKTAGVVTITTKDFVEVSRTGGTDGRTLNLAATATNITNYVMGDADTVAMATSVVPAQKKYVRSYSPTDTGLSALIKHYTDEHSGTFGVSLIELSGDRRRASVNGDKKFTTASTYKAYVAYSTLKRVENGTLKWTDQIAGGRNLEKCFDDMIVLSDNPCAEALVQKIGYNALHADVQALGLTGTSFIDKESFKTTANNLSTFMANLESGQLSISTSSRERLISAMKRNTYRQGIPAGASGTVADKVGFLDGLLHDMAIVYSPSGTYVLSIMTDGSSWSSIAELTREIEKLRAQ